MRTPGSGRKKGTPNKHTAELKECILEAGHRAGMKHGKDGMTSYLEHQAVENPTAYMGLIGKVLPTTIKGNGENGEFVVKVTIGGNDPAKA